MPESRLGGVMVDFPIREIAFGSAEYAASLALREDVLLRPFGIPLDAARVDDAAAIHLGAFAPNTGACVGCLLLIDRPDAGVQMRQVAVRQDLQRRAIGRRLALAAQAEALSRGAELLFAAARCTALPFYRALGYSEVGPVFEQVGLPHRRVEKWIGEARV